MNVSYQCETLPAAARQAVAGEQPWIGRAHWTWRAIETLATWADRVRSRRQLAQLSAYQLKDIGISRSDVMEELNKPFWRS